jgi:SAM-dependent methyltransferase
MTEAWRPRFACPECRSEVSPDGDDRLRCERCRLGFQRESGVYRFLSPARSALGAAFARHYRIVREREGYRSVRPEYYRMLPSVPSDDPQAPIWRVRRESYAHLLQHALPAVWQGPTRVLDLGAGSGWLSHRLASFGHHVVALDRLDDEQDGLRACRHYPVSFTVVQADFDALPFEEGQFDLAVFDGSLHYSPNPAATLAEARRVLAPGGTIAVVDSPMFDRDEDGRSMVVSERRRMALEHGVPDAGGPGLGYLTFEALDRLAASFGLHSAFTPSHGPVGWRVRRRLARVRLGRRPAAFGVWVAR